MKSPLPNLALLLLVGVLGLSRLDTAAADSVSATAAADGKLPAYLIEVPNSVSDVLVAETDAATMYRFVRSSNGIDSKGTSYMSIGTAGAGKKRAWDRKTPLGIYFVVDSLDTSKLHDKYGVAAFPLDYPNAWDRYNGRTGYGIWLHGVDRKHPDRPPLDTDGCLALPNDALLQLADSLKPLVTPVIVAREIAWAWPADLDAVRVEFRRALEAWRVAQIDGDLAAYLSLYAEDFRYRELDRAEWASFRYGTFDNRRLSAMQLEDVMLIQDPEEPGLYLSRFMQVMETDDGPVTTTKRLYWRRSNDNLWRIISEDAG